MQGKKSFFDLSPLQGLTRDTDVLAIETADGTRKVLASDLFSMLGGDNLYLPRSLANYEGKNLGEIYTPQEFKSKVESGDFSGLDLGAVAGWPFLQSLLHICLHISSCVYFLHPSKMY